MINTQYKVKIKQMIRSKNIKSSEVSHAHTSFNDFFFNVSCFLLPSFLSFFFIGAVVAVLKNSRYTWTQNIKMLYTHTHTRGHDTVVNSTLAWMLPVRKIHAN